MSCRSKAHNESPKFRSDNAPLFVNIYIINRVPALVVVHLQLRYRRAGIIDELQVFVFSFLYEPVELGLSCRAVYFKFFIFAHVVVQHIEGGFEVGVFIISQNKEANLLRFVKNLFQAINIHGIKEVGIDILNA